MEYILLIIFGWLLTELLLWAGFKWLRSGFQWLIMKEDKLPTLDAKALEKFSKKGMDPELGWVRKPYTTGQEKGRNGKSTQFTVNEFGARSNPGYDDKQPEISLFGDSYAFGRQVNDDQTWAHQVSKKIDKNILNFGVGNYGLDQAILRMERELPKRQSKLALILVVPETICRVQAMWKHYSEYGNTFAFKPRYVLDDAGKLIFKKNKIDEVEKYINYDQYIDEIKDNDRFYESKFLKDILIFPFLIKFIKSFKRNGPLVWALIRSKITHKQEVMDRPFQMILRNNHHISMSLYHDDYSNHLMHALVEKANEVADENGCKFLFCMVPQLQDLELIKEHGIYYQKFLEKVGESVNMLDLTHVLISQENIGECYTHDMYGGHLSKFGNELVSDLIANEVVNILDGVR